MSSWISPTDKSLNVVQLGNLSTKSHEINSLKILHDLVFATLGSQQKITSLSSIKKVLLDLGSTVYVTSVPVCPNNYVVKRDMSNDSLVTTFHSLDGYNFSAEFSYVYRNSSSSTTAYDDAIAVCSRAISAADPSLDEYQIQGFVDYVIRITAWEASIAQLTCAQTLEKCLPDIPITVTKSEMSVVKVYLSCGESAADNNHDSDNAGVDQGQDKNTATATATDMFFWVRICPMLEPAKDALPQVLKTSLFSLSRKQPETNENSNKQRSKQPPLSAEDTLALQYSQMCYYRKYRINDKIVEAFKKNYTSDNLDRDATGTSRSAALPQPQPQQQQQQSVPPPPPPKSPSPEDVRVFMAMALVPPSSSQRAVSRAVALDMRELADDDDAYEHGYFDHGYFDHGYFDHGNKKENERSESEGQPVDAAAAGADGTRESADEDGDDEPSNNNKSKPPAPAAAADKNKGVSAVVAVSRSQLIADPSPCAELVCWGENSSYSLGVGVGNTTQKQQQQQQSSSSRYGDRNNRGGEKDTEKEEESLRPCAVPLPLSLILERIRMVACSSRHTVILSHLGNVYSCGDNSDGALGTGDMENRAELTLISWPVDGSAKIVKVAVGSGALGSHSLALDAEGIVYAWGVPQATGLGIVRPVLSPTKIDTFLLDAEERRRRSDAAAAAGQANNNNDSNNNNNDFSSVLPTDALPCRDIACGSGFSVAILRSGRVCSWGTWSHGRLGLGQTPVARDGKKVARYQLRPAYVPGIRTAVAVACGESHTLCLLESGELLAWGQNHCGQLGSGVTSSGFLRDELYPVRINPFTSRPTSKNKPSDASSPILLRKIAAGLHHSVAIDSEGGVWTWGARGAPCLGHCDPLVLGGTWGEFDMRRTKSIFTVSVGQSRIMVPYELRRWCDSWSNPRRIAGFDGSTTGHGGVAVEQISAGEMHTALLTKDGSLYLCGAGPVVPPFISVSALGEATGEDDNDDDDDDDEQFELKNAEKLKRFDEMDVSKLAVTVAAPRRPSASWLGGLSTRRVLLAAGAGSHCFVLLDDEVISANLTFDLLRKAMLPPGALATGDVVDAGDVLEDASLDSHVRSDLDGSTVSSSYFEQRGHTDMMLIAAGKVLLAHRALIAQRSPELRDMIAMEAPADDSDGLITQVLLPELQAPAAKALMAFLYTDVLPTSCISDVSVLRSLVRAAKSLRIPRLQLIAERILRALNIVENGASSSYSKTTAKSAAGGSSSVNGSVIDLDMPQPTLARDLGAMVGDPLYADIRFVADGRAVIAHRFVLEARSEYFRAMFRSGMMEMGTAHDSGFIQRPMIDVVVPDSFVGFLRLLIFLYTDSLPDGSDSALLEDLLTADRYGVLEMKRLCESMLVPSSSNYLELLRVADAVGANSLRGQVLAFIRDHVFHEASDHQASSSSPSSSRSSAAKNRRNRGRRPVDETSTTKTPKEEHSSSSRKKSNDASLGHEQSQSGEEESQEDEDGDEAENILEEMRNEFPEAIESIEVLRKVSSPLPPSQILVRRSKVVAEIKKIDSQYKPVLPLWAAGAAGVAALVYHRIGQIVVLGPVVPVINAIFIAAVIYFTYRSMTKNSTR